MALTNRQRKTFQTLQSKQASGAIGPKGQAKLAKLQGYQSGSLTNPAAGRMTNKIKPNKPGTGVNAEMQFANQAAENQIRYTNPNQSNPFGSQTTEIDPVTGQPKVTQTLSPEEQRIYGAGAGLSGTGREMALSRLQNDPRFSQGFNPGSNDEQRARIEEQVFGRLTKNLERDKASEQQSLSQSLAERGIPVGSELYNNQMREFNQRFDDRTTDARQRATEIGGQEWQRDYNIGQSTYQQGYQDLANLQSMGPGQTLPQFQGFNAPGYNPMSPVNAYNTIKGVGQNQQQLDQANSYNMGMLGVAKQNANTNAAGSQPQPDPNDPNG